MLTLVVLAYLACVVVAFRVVKIPVKPVSVAVAVLTGVLLVGGIAVLWKQGAPMTEQMTLRRHVVRIVPNAREFVSKVHVKWYQKVAKGEPLFDISKERFEYAENEAKATLAASESTFSKLEAAVTAAEAAVKKADADTGIAKAQIDTAKRLRRSSPGAVAKLKIAEAEASYQAAQANSQVARASLKEARATLAAGTASVEVARASLNSAQYALTQTTYRSPVDGQLINFQIREQTPVARWQFTAVGTIMDLSDTAILAVYPQNLLSHVRAGDTAEVAFRRTPGAIATGKVDLVVKYTGEGQFKPGDRLPSVASVGSKGSLLVRIRLDDEELARALPLGAAGTAAVYTDFARPFQAISKVALRMKAWLYYLPL